MVTIELAQSADIDDLTRLNEIVHSIHVNNEPQRFKPTNPEEIHAWFKQSFNNDNGRIWIAREEGQAVGYVIAFLRDSPSTPFAHSGRLCELDQIVVAPSARRQGVGRRLVQKVVFFAKDNEVARVQLTSWSFNEEAHRLFQDAGFETRRMTFDLRLS